MYSYGPAYMAEQKQDDQLEHTKNSYVRIRDVALKTSQRRWTIGRSGERGSGISVLPTRNDDDVDDEGLCKMQTASFKIWTWLAVFISYDDNHYSLSNPYCKNIVKS